MRSASLAALAALVLAFVVSGCQQQTAKGPDAAFGGKARSDRAFEGRIYYLPDNATKLRDFKTLPAHGTIYAQQLNVPDQDFQLGFPGVTDRNTWFAIDYKGDFRVDKAGRYGFRLSSDDGSRLLIDGKTVVDNDGVHGTVSASGQADLTAGRHSIEVQYFQGPPVRVSLQLFCTQANGAEAIFPGCGLNLHRPETSWSWLMWLLAIIVIAAGALVLARRKRPPEQPPAAAAA
jgi:hypothetical protein